MCSSELSCSSAQLVVSVVEPVPETDDPSVERLGVPSSRTEMDEKKRL
jgi:hypothetical protein